MEVAVQRIGSVAVATLVMQELDASNVAWFKLDMAEVVETNTRVVLDLSCLQFIDSSGLGAFISLLRRLNAKDGDLKLCGMSKTVRAAFELVRLNRVFDIFADEEEAVRAFEVSRRPSGHD